MSIQRLRTADETTAFLDADNTLWDTDGVYAAAQSRLLDGVLELIGADAAPSEPLAFLRAVDQAIAARHQDGLRYPPLLLVRGLERALVGEAPDAAARAAFRGRHDYRIDSESAGFLVDQFRSGLGAVPDLRTGVAKGLAELSAAGVRLLVVSEAAKRRVEATAARHGILGLFDRILEGRKRPEFYGRILALIGRPSRAFMVGDQVDRDIIPARAAGLKTIHFPSGFRPRWTPADASPDHVVADFAEVPGIVCSGLVPVRAVAS
jgi:putative hydrolase of the HAD superfamily